MFKSSRQSSAKPNNSSKHEGSDKQKQKKKLSFKDPEVEKPRGSSTQTTVLDPAGVRVPSLEDLKLEDQALLIARNVGFAFVKPQPDKGTDSLQAAGRVRVNKGFDEYLREDSVLESSRLKTRTEQDTIANPQTKDQGYLEALSPIKPGPTAMRCPVVEFPPESPLRNPSIASEQQQQPQHRLPTAAHHQIQLLSYQLEQQRQQTQTAMYQIQLLKDQMEAESAARYKAQVHNHHLMMQNKELLDHIQRLFQQVQDLERKLDHYERKPVALQSPSEERNQGIFGMQGPNNIGSRRNSSQSLWSSTPSLNPTAYNPSRRVSTTSLLSPQVDPKAGEGPRRLSIKDDTTSRFSTFDSDWRYRRRGSSGPFSSTTSLTKSKTSESNLSTGLNATSTDARKSPTMSLSIPELRLTLDTTSATRDAVQEDDTRLKKDKLLIREPSKDRASSPASLKDDQSISRGFKPIKLETSSFTSKLSRTTERDSYESDSELLNQKKANKTFGSLRLFNS